MNPTSEAQIRRARPEDLPGARQLMLRVLAEDFRLDVQPRWHADILDLEAAYLRHPRQALFVAVTPQDGVVGTAAIRKGGPKAPPNPEWLAARYRGPGVAQLVRVWVHREHRRRGLARSLVRAAVAWAVEAGGYDTIYLHTNASVPGAEAFWRSLGAQEIHDARPDGDPWHTIHFELDARALLDQHTSLDQHDRHTRTG
ncbi:GNAT family N-acetyltransferase [Carbonactinospora thermoautotrophica]|uniref:GNAT family N-acetyltransferase n=1 Tax=Carbonactinospora thermoautotrophica TaxID=1469144 RepID=UPI00226F8C1F|nr:GNAT family N-acetyltransferase [Carbonactinospora thermoautotrophica]MCX9190365.1 GNAT family N-acetyltransferase [Carbonactinospora thermoautotrophica]